MENGGQDKQRKTSVTGNSDLLKLIGQDYNTSEQSLDTSIISRWCLLWFGLSYNQVKLLHLIDNVVAYTFAGEKVYELIISTDSVVGTFATGHTITATANDDADVTLYR